MTTERNTSENLPLAIDRDASHRIEWRNEYGVLVLVEKRVKAPETFEITRDNGRESVALTTYQQWLDVLNDSIPGWTATITISR